MKYGKSPGVTAKKLIDEKAVDYLIYAKVETNGGKSGNIITIPLFLLDKFDVNDYASKLIGDDFESIKSPFLYNSARHS